MAGHRDFSDRPEVKRIEFSREQIEQLARFVRVTEVPHEQRS